MAREPIPGCCSSARRAFFIAPPLLRDPRPGFGAVVENFVAAVLLGRRRQKCRLQRPRSSAMARSSGMAIGLAIFPRYKS